MSMVIIHNRATATEKVYNSFHQLKKIKNALVLNHAVFLHMIITTLKQTFCSVKSTAVVYVHLFPNPFAVFYFVFLPIHNTAVPFLIKDC